MRITYLHHSGFLVELEACCLIFDYFAKGLTRLPDKPVVVFASHAHHDHYDPGVFQFVEGREVTAVLSKDIPKRRWPAGIEVLSVSAHRDYALPHGIALTTLQSTDAGVAFYLRTPEGCVYHAGDLNDWHWDDIDLPWNEAQKNGYMASLSAIAEVVQEDGKIPDAAFVPVDSRLGEFFWMGLDGFMQKVGAEHIFPMHLFGDKKVIDRMKAHPCAAAYADRILGTGTEGEVFDITEGETE